MTPQQFFDKYNGKFVDYDKAYGYQCMDIVRQFMKEVLGYQPYDAIPPVTYAKYAFVKYNPKYFSQIKNGKTNFPKNGDIVIWGTYPFVTGIAGHIAICSRADVNSMITFDQNYPTRSFCKFVHHNYRGVLGWLRAIK